MAAPMLPLPPQMMRPGLTPGAPDLLPTPGQQTMLTAPQGGLLDGFFQQRAPRLGNFLRDRSSALLSMSLPWLMTNNRDQAFQMSMAGLNQGRQVDYARQKDRREEEQRAAQEAALRKLLASQGLNQDLAGVPGVAGQVLAQSFMPREPAEYGFTEVGNQLVRTDPRSGTATPVFTGAPQERSRPTAYTDAAKLKADLDAGLITPEQYQQALAAPPAVNFDDESKLRAEYLRGSSDYMSVRDSYSRLEAAAKDGTGASDIAMVYAYMKMLDPGSVVREGEFATAEQAGGIPAQVINLYNRVINGERLPQFVRDQFLQQGRRQFEAATSRQQRYSETYRGLAGDYRMDPSRITPDLSAGVTVQPAAPPPRQGAVVDGYRFNGGDPADPNSWTKVQ